METSLLQKKQGDNLLFYGVLLFLLGLLVGLIVPLNGYQFRVFRHDDKVSTSLHDDFGQYLIVDPSGQTWAGCFPRGSGSFATKTV
jgi:hypothetical protein